jgi:hypothetical protein
MVAPERSRPETPERGVIVIVVSERSASAGIARVYTAPSAPVA